MGCLTNTALLAGEGPYHGTRTFIHLYFMRVGSPVTEEEYESGGMTLSLSVGLLPDDVSRELE